MALVTWLVASPAFAAAPLCDHRGATMFAPAPTLDPQLASVDLGTAEGTCWGVRNEATIGTGRPPVVRDTSSHPPFALFVRHRRVRCPFEHRKAAAVLRASLPSGVCPRVERPPRAH